MAERIAGALIALKSAEVISSTVRADLEIMDISRSDRAVAAPYQILRILVKTALEAATDVPTPNLS